MASIPGHTQALGIVQGVTWGTEVQAATKLGVSSFSAPASREVRVTGNHNRAFLPAVAKQGRQVADFNAAGMATFGEGWTLLYALFAGASSAPTEQTGGQGDYLHNLDIAAAANKFFSCAWEVESDVVHALASVILSSFSFNFQENEPVTWQAAGMADSKLFSGSTTSNAELNALADLQNEELAMMNGANVYFRLADYSTGTALDSGDNLALATASIQLSIPRTRYYGVRGASTRSSYMPYGSGLLDGTFTVTLAEQDDTVLDVYAKYNSGTVMMAEIFVDGAGIGATGVNTSLKFQLPSLTPVNDNGSDGIASQAGLSQPQMTFKMNQAPAAPSGMSGVTNLMRLVTIDERTTAYLA
jgi:hypothetical protein